MEWSRTPRGLVLYDARLATKERRIPAATERKRKARPAVCGAAIFSGTLRKQDFNGSDRQVGQRPAAAWLHWPSSQPFCTSPNLPHEPHRRLLLIFGGVEMETMCEDINCIDDICRGQPEPPICRLLYDLRDLVVCTSSRSKWVGAVYFVPGRCGENL